MSIYETIMIIFGAMTFVLVLIKLMIDTIDKFSRKGK